MVCERNTTHRQGDTRPPHPPGRVMVSRGTVESRSRGRGTGSTQGLGEEEGVHVFECRTSNPTKFPQYLPAKSRNHETGNELQPYG